MQKIYLAGSSKPAERPRVAAIMGQLHVMAGLHVVHDWLVEVDANDAMPEHELDARTRRSAMDLDYNAIDVADYMWFLAPPPESPTKGGWCELGYATCRSRMTGSPLILISGEHCSSPSSLKGRTGSSRRTWTRSSFFAIASCGCAPMAENGMQGRYGDTARVLSVEPSVSGGGCTVRVQCPYCDGTHTHDADRAPFDFGLKTAPCNRHSYRVLHVHDPRWVVRLKLVEWRMRFASDVLDGKYDALRYVHDLLDRIRKL